MYTVKLRFSVVLNQYINAHLINHPNCGEETVLKFRQVEIKQRAIFLPPCILVITPGTFELN